MLISHKHNFIFIHIYKTAGTSVMNEFVSHSRLTDKLAYKYWLSRKAYGAIIRLMGWHNSGMMKFTGYHKHVKAYQVAEKIGHEKLSSFFSF